MQIPSKKNDALLFYRLKKGDKKAYIALYRLYWQRLYVASYNLLKNKELCEEIVQDVFIELWNNRAKIEIKISLKSYLYACIRYKVFSEFRKNKIQNAELFENLETRFYQTTPETKIMYQELLMQIEVVVKSLPEKCQNVYRLSREEQLSHKEIAEKLNISTKTVEGHISIALRALRKALGPIFFLDFLLFIIQK